MSFNSIFDFLFLFVRSFMHFLTGVCAIIGGVFTGTCSFQSSQIPRFVQYGIYPATNILCAILSTTYDKNKSLIYIYIYIYKKFGGGGGWWSGQARPGQARPGQARPGQARPGLGPSIHNMLNFNIQYMNTNDKCSFVLWIQLLLFIHTKMCKTTNVHLQSLFFSVSYTVAGLIDSLIYHSARAIQKKIDLGKAL